MPNVPQLLLFAPISSLNSLRFVLKSQKKAEKSRIPIFFPTQPWPEQEAGAEWLSGCRSTVSLIRTGGDFLINCRAKSTRHRRLFSLPPAGFVPWLLWRDSSPRYRHTACRLTRLLSAREIRSLCFLFANCWVSLRKQAAVCVSFPLPALVLLNLQSHLFGWNLSSQLWH